MKSYDVIIVNYNGGKIIQECLGSVFDSIVKPKRVIIYDNNSNDDSVTKIKSFQQESIIFIEGKNNIGFGPGNNEALKAAKSDFILFMNNDLLLDRDCARTLLEAFQNDEIAVVNPLIIKGWERQKDSEIYSFGAVLNSAGFGYSITEHGRDITNLTCFSGACFMARRRYIEEIGFEKNFFLYYEEPALSIELLKRGLKIARTSAAKCYHLESYSSPQKQNDGIAFRQFYGILNRWYLLGRHWPGRLMPYALTVNLLHLLYFLAFFLRNGKFQNLRLIYLAPANFLRGSKERKKTAKVKFWYQALARDSVQKYLLTGKKVVSKK